MRFFIRLFPRPAANIAIPLSIRTIAVVPSLSVFISVAAFAYRVRKKSPTKAGLSAQKLFAMRRVRPQAEAGWVGAAQVCTRF